MAIVRKEQAVKTWTQEEAISLCCAIEKFSPDSGYHVALTGGCLYKKGNRKDCDVIFYSIRQLRDVNNAAMLEALEVRLGIRIVKDHGFCVKAKWLNKSIDLLFPENSGVYNEKT